MTIALFISERHSPSFRLWRAHATVLVVPIQFLVDAPVRLIRWIGDSVSTQQELLGENAKLRAHELILESKLQRLIALQRENEHLRELLSSTTEVVGKTKVARLLAVDLDPSSQQMVIDKGTNEEVVEGLPILDAYGVMGQVVRVGPLTSKVLLITDTRSAIPVQNSRNGIRAIAVGLGSNGLLALLNVPDTTDIQKGDLFVSSGLGQRFPAGYPVAVVSKVTVTPGEQFMSVSLAPSARLNRAEQVLLVWPEKADHYEEVKDQLSHKGSNEKIILPSSLL